MANGVLVFAEATDDGALVPVSAELLAAARSLATPVICAILGSGVESLSKDLVAAGADQVIVVNDTLLRDYQGDAYVPIAERIARQVDPSVILLPQSMIGRDLAPRLAQRLGTAVAMDCVSLSMNGDKLVAERPCYGGNARARYVFNANPQIATVRAKAYEALPADPSRQGEVVNQPAEINPESIRTRIVSRRREKAEGVRLEDASVVVSGGRGLGGPEGFKPLEELAEVLGGAVGASRAVCDLGWYPVACQIGLTGKIVTPGLYIAVGISGASQHMAGVAQVKNIVSINKDPEATIFKQSKFAVVGDWKEILPAFTKKVRELKAS